MVAIVTGREVVVVVIGREVVAIVTGGKVAIVTWIAMAVVLIGRATKNILRQR